MASSWVEIDDHTADTGMEIFADELEEVFLEAAGAFSEMTSEDFDMVGSSIHHSITVEEEDLVNLLHSWLNEILYLFDSKHFLANGWKQLRIIETDETFVLTCELHGGTFVYGEHEAGTEVKAVTWHNLTLEPTQDDTWYACVILDI